MIKYISIFRLVLRCILVARKDNLTGFSTGLTNRSKNLDPTGNPTGAGRPDGFPSLAKGVPGPPTIEMLPLIKIMTKSLLFLRIFAYNSNLQ